MAPPIKTCPGTIRREGAYQSIMITVTDWRAVRQLRVVVGVVAIFPEGPDCFDVPTPALWPVVVWNRLD